MSIKTEQSLAEALQNGDMAAYEQLYRKLFNGAVDYLSASLDLSKNDAWSVYIRLIDVSATHTGLTTQIRNDILKASGIDLELIGCAIFLANVYTNRVSKNGCLPFASAYPARKLRIPVLYNFTMA